jgi:hypothetical protein
VSRRPIGREKTTATTFIITSIISIITISSSVTKHHHHRCRQHHHARDRRSGDSQTGVLLVPVAASGCLGLGYEAVAHTESARVADQPRLPTALAPGAGFFVEVVRIVFCRLLLRHYLRTFAKSAEFTAPAKAGTIANEDIPPRRSRRVCTSFSSRA